MIAGAPEWLVNIDSREEGAQSESEDDDPTTPQHKENITPKSNYDRDDSP